MNRMISIVWTVCVLALSTVPIAAAYTAWWALPALVVCVLVPVGLVLGGRALRIPSVWIAVGVGMLAVLAGTALDAAGIDADPTWIGGGVLAPLVDAIPRLLTAPRPAPPEIGYLVPAALLVWITALAVALAATARARARIAPLIGAAVLQTAGALLTAGTGDPIGLVAAASIALLLLGWVALPAERTDRRRSSRASRTAWAASAIGAVVVGALALPAAAATTGVRFEPRLLVPPPQLPAQATNPLPDVALWNQDAGPLFTITSQAGAAPQRVRLAVLPDFDGAAWMLDGTLRQLGVVDEPDLAPGEWRRTVTYRVDPAALDTAWVPSIGRAQRVQGQAVLMDADTGSLVAADGTADARVTVTASVDDPSEDAIERAGAPPAGSASRYLALPRVPTGLVRQARSLTAGAASRWGQVTALADFVRAGRTLDQGAPSGSSYGRIVEFLFGDRAAGGQVGTTEQFAASFAVLARAVGVPSRLVVGFDAGTDAAAGGSGAGGAAGGSGGAGSAGASTVRVTGADARVWAEVYLSRVGWVTVDPSPDAAIRTEHTPPADGTAAPTPAHTGSPAPGASAPARAGRAETVGVAWGGVAAVAAGIVVLAALVPLLVLAVRRARRRARWRAAGARGAWAQVLDAATLAGRTPPAGATPDDVASALADAVSGPGPGGVVGSMPGEVSGFVPGAVSGFVPDAVSAPGPGADVAPIEADVRMLAARAQRSAYTPAGVALGGAASAGAASGSPGLGGAASDDDWAAAVRIERALRVRSSRWRRMVWNISPVVLHHNPGAPGPGHVRKPR